MSRSSKRLRWFIGGAVAFVVVVALAARLRGDANPYKPRLEAAASHALGVNVRFRGRLSLGFLPSLHVEAGAPEVLGDRGEAVVSAKQIRLWIELAPLLRKQLRLRRVELTRPTFLIVREPEGRLDFESVRKMAAAMVAPDVESVSLTDGTLHYVDKRSGAGFEATHLDVVAHRTRLADADVPRTLKTLSFEARLTCGEIRAKNLSLSHLQVSAKGRDGVFDLEPVRVRIFGGTLAGKIRVDLSGSVPMCRIHGSLPHFRIEEFLRTLSPAKAAEGTMDFSADVSMHGTNPSQMVRTATGSASLQGRNLLLAGSDLDGSLSKFESSQNFNLVDVGAVFFAGPMGLAVTRGYDFASLFHGSGGKSEIRTVVSDWSIERGVAYATDVAMATAKNRIALQGGLDFVDQRFADVTVAVVDGKGCPRVRQTIRGAFAKPEVEKPRILTSFAGPLLKLYRRTRALLPSGPCKVFYSGRVAAPK